MSKSKPPHFVTLGLFIIDEFSFADENGTPTGRVVAPEIGGGGTYAAVGARIWLPSNQIGMVVDRGTDFPSSIQEKLDGYGPEMWIFRDQDHGTTRALNSYRGEHRSFEYLTPRIRITPNDIQSTWAACPRTLHFICSPTRAAAIISEVHQVEGWKPLMIYEPIPDRCIPAELPALREVLPFVYVLSPNAEEALSLLGYALPPTKVSIERAAAEFLSFGVGESGQGVVIIRSGPLGCFALTRAHGGRWIEAYWSTEDSEKIVDVTGAGNSFLGGLAAGLYFTSDIYEASLYATVSASFTIEQGGLPAITSKKGDVQEYLWNGELPQLRLENLRARMSHYQDRVSN